ncbi:uncharacterized protein [Rutidosis leptorrhynchoides]|uniref:uncharacterized protein n=1 Tax=Rutidosis leptorrhynchoides TaxID=125765 RepID=UPI003A994E1F
MDKWMWVGPSSNFSVSHARSIIDSYEFGNFVRPTDWCNLVPIKVNIFNWRLRLNRLPTKSNLLDRHIDVGNSSCSLCNTLDETADHLFAKCSITSLIWARIQLWIDLTIPAWNSVDDIWASVDGVPITNNQRIVLKVITHSVLWNIWNKRNSIIFKDARSRNSVLFDDIVVFAFNWLYSRRRLLVRGTACKILKMKTNKSQAPPGNLNRENGKFEDHRSRRLEMESAA